MLIQQLAQQTGVARQTIRYYESIGLLPPPKRAGNNYRSYGEADVERLRFIASARSLGFSLEDVTEFIRARDRGRLPCKQVLESVDGRIAELDQRIADLLALRATLDTLRRKGRKLPPDKRCDADCVCYLLKVQRNPREITFQVEDIQND